MKRWANAPCVISGVLVLVASASAGAKDLPDSFDFAVSKTGKWALVATTHIARPDDKQFPTVQRIDCRGENEDMQFSVAQGGNLMTRLRFLGLPDKDGQRGEITLTGDRLWLYVDSNRWEFAHIAARPTTFSNLKYPERDSDIILTVWRGYEAVRKNETDPWLNLNSLNQQLLSARRIHWSYKSRNWKDVDARVPQNQLPKGWNKTRYPVDNAGLADAVKWCARQVSSDAAYVLPANLKEAAES